MSEANDKASTNIGLDEITELRKFMSKLAARCAIDDCPTIMAVDHNSDRTPAMAGIRVHRQVGARLVSKVNCRAPKR